MQIPVIDTHVHLDQLSNPEEAIQEARKAGLSGLIAVGLDIASNEKILSFSRQYPGFVFPALGYHPWNITDFRNQKQSGFSSKTPGRGCRPGRGRIGF